ncbi:MAG: hypothetical protein ACXAAP_12590, partial [Candidatus Thorarchaeota archaeon]
MAEKFLNMETGQEDVLVERSTDPVILPQPYASPGDFDAQYPVPLDPNEVLNLCEEITLSQFIPEEDYALKSYTWREMTSLEFSSGTFSQDYALSFADGECPENYEHDGSNSTVDLKNIGAKKTLSLSDIKHSIAVAAANYHGIARLTGPAAVGEGMPGGSDFGTFAQEAVAGVKEKEIRLGMTLVMNGEDWLLVQGDKSSNSLEFDGIEQWSTNNSCTHHTNDNTASGTYSATAFDRWLGEGCAKPDTLMGHPTTMQEVLSSYFQLGFQGSQVINFADGNRITPGFNFAGWVNTGIGRMKVVADNNFTRTAAGSTLLQADVWATRMVHNGEPLVIRKNQFPLSLKDLAP